MFYSSSTGGFYDPAIHGSAIPAGAREISKAQHASLLAAQALGKSIAADADGYPVAVDPPAPSLEQVRAGQIASLEKSRRAAVASGKVTVQGKDFPVDAEYRELITNMVSQHTRGKQIPSELRGAGGNPVALNAVLLGQIEDALTAHVNAAWARYWQRMSAVQAAFDAGDAAAIKAVVW